MFLNKLLDVKIDTNMSLFLLYNKMGKKEEVDYQVVYQTYYVLKVRYNLLVYLKVIHINFFVM